MIEIETLTAPARVLTMLNEAGDTTISWTEDRDEEMQRIIEQKMKEGVTFFVVTRKAAPAKRGPQLKTAADAIKRRSLVIPDEDLAKFVASGSGQVGRSPDEPIETSRVSRDAKEVVKSGSAVGAKQRRGG